MQKCQASRHGRPYLALQLQRYSSYSSTEGYEEEDAAFQHSVQRFFGAVVKVQPFGRSLHARHRAGSSIEDGIREWRRCNPMAMDSVDDGDGGATSTAV